MDDKEQQQILVANWMANNPVVQPAPAVASEPNDGVVAEILGIQEKTRQMTEAALEGQREPIGQLADKVDKIGMNRLK